MALDRGRFRPELVGILSSEGRRALRVTLGASVVLALIEMAALALTVPVLALLSSSPPTFGPLADWVERVGEDDALLYLAGLVVLLFMVKAAGRVALNQWTMNRLADEEAWLMGHLATRILTAPYVWQIQHNSATFIRTVYASVDSVVNRVLYPLTIMASEATLVVGVLLVILVVSPLALGLTVAYFGVLLVALRLTVIPRARRQGLQQEAATRALLQSLQESVSSIKVIKTYGVDRAFSADVEEHALSAARAKSGVRYLNELPRVVLEAGLVGGVAIVAVVLVGLRGRVESLPVIALLAVGGFRLLPSLARLSSAVVTLRAGRASVESVAELTQQLDDIDGAAGSTRPSPSAEASKDDEDHLDPTEPTLPKGSWSPLRSPRGAPRIVVTDLAFQYPGGTRPALDGVSFTVEPGEFLAVVGGSGAGKTTLVDVVLGLLHPHQGSVRIERGGCTRVIDANGVLDLGPGPAVEVAYVPQDVALLDATVTENVVLRRDVQPDGVGLASSLAKAQLAGVVAALPHGANSRLGERGIRLSGGERQRLGLARALYRSPELLVLDEATSALDSHTEARVAEAVNALRGEMTIVIIAHRLSTVRDADRVVLLEAGTIRASGSFQELAENDEHFAESVHLARLDR